MSKIGSAILISLICIPVWAGVITWGSGDFSGVLSDGWLVALYKDVDADGFDATSIDFTSGATDSDDMLLNITDVISSGRSGTGWGTMFNQLDGGLSYGDSVVSVIFNSSSLDGSATMAWYSTAFVGGLPANSGGQAVLPASDSMADYVVTAITQVVPEPATLLLVGTGGISVWLVHRRKLETKT
jgi:hypothetical protein